MNRKRSAILPGLYGSHKRPCTGVLKPLCVQQCTNILIDETGHEQDSMLIQISDSKAALLLLKGLFATEKFNDRVPPIMFKHQVYSIVKNRTKADHEIEELRNSGEIRLFKLGCDSNDISIVFTEDYNSHVEKSIKGTHHEEACGKFLHTVLPCCQDVSVNKQVLMGKYGFSDKEITSLVNAGVLTVRDVGSWWLAIPGAGIFMKNFIRGRKAIVTIIRHCKYREILQTCLEERRLPKSAPLGIMYHIHDIVGAELVDCVNTTSGVLMRLKDCAK